MFDICDAADGVPVSSVSPVGSWLKTVTTIYYRGAAAGSFKLTNAVTDSESGPGSSATAALGGSSEIGRASCRERVYISGGAVSLKKKNWNARTHHSPPEVVTAAHPAGTP